LSDDPPSPASSSRPINELLALLGTRWTLRVLWELRDEALTFRELQARCDQVSPTVLNQRLRALRDAALVTQAQSRGYELTPLGRELGVRLLELSDWSRRWAAARTGLVSDNG